MIDETINDPQPQIGQRTDRKRHAFAGKPPRQDVVVERAIAVVDAPDAQYVKGFPDIARRPLFPRMRGEKEAGVSSAREDALEFARRMSGFRRIETDPDNLVTDS